MLEKSVWNLILVVVRLPYLAADKQLPPQAKAGVQLR
jgi:hypothetical protein